MGQEQNGRRPNLDISTQRFCVGIGQPTCTSQTTSRTGLLQGTRQGNWFRCVDEVVLDADANAACNIRDRLHDDGIALWTLYREVKALLVE